MIQLDKLLFCFDLVKDEPYIEIITNDNGSSFIKSPKYFMLSMPHLYGLYNKEYYAKSGFLSQEDIEYNIKTLELVNQFNLNYSTVLYFINLSKDRKRMNIKMYDNLTGNLLHSFDIILARYTCRKLFYMLRAIRQFFMKLKGGN